MATDWNAQLLEAAKSGNVNLLQEALDNGADINARDANRNTALIWASICRRPETISALIVAGAKVDLTQKDGTTALICASLIGHATIARTLIAAGADIATENHNGNTALTAARGYGYTEIAELLQNATRGIRPSREEAGLLPPPPTKEQASADRRWREAEEIRDKLRAGITDPSEVGF